MHDEKLREYIHDLAKESYQYQLTRIDSVRDRILGISRILLVLGGSIIFLWSNYEYTIASNYDYWFFVPLAIATVLFTATVALLLYCLGWAFKYYFIPNMEELHEFAAKDDDYKQATEEELDLVKDFKIHITKEYTKGAKHNLDVNQKRNNKILFSTQISIVTFILTLWSLPNYIYKKSIIEPTTNKTMSDNNENNSDNTSESTSANTTDSSINDNENTAISVDKPVRPTFPRGTFLAEASQREAKEGQQKQPKEITEENKEN